MNQFTSGFPLQFGDTLGRTSWPLAGGGAPTISFNASTNLLESTAAGQWYADGSPISGETGTTLDPWDPTWRGAVITCNGSNSLELWEPSDITGWNSTFDAAVWLPGEGITQSGGAVSQWTDIYNDWPATQGTGSLQPTYGATSFNGGPGLTFADGRRLDTANPGLSADNPVYRVWTGLANFTASVYATPFGGVGGAYQLRANSDGKYEILRASQASLVTSASASSNRGSDVNFTSRFGTSGAYSFEEDGASLGSGTVSASSWTVSTASRVGGFGGEGMKGVLGPFACVDTNLSSGDLAKLQGFLAWASGNQTMLWTGHTYENAPAFN